MGSKQKPHRESEAKTADRAYLDAYKRLLLALGRAAKRKEKQRAK